MKKSEAKRIAKEKLMEATSLLLGKYSRKQFKEVYGDEGTW